MKVWNSAVTTQPAQVVRCGNEAEVSAAVGRAREEGLPLSVLGGGHDWAGRALCENGLVIDVGGLKKITVEDDVATVGGGVTSLEAMDAAGATGQAVVAGTVGSVGLTGLTIGGGYGPQLGSRGLAADNLLGARVVLADGTAVEADEDLLWALKGGGGNFGVVTEMRVRLSPFETATAGVVLFPGEQASEVFAALGDLLAQAPDELAVLSGAMDLPDGTPAVYTNPTWVGHPPLGAEWVRRIERLGTPMVSQVGPVSSSATLRAADEMFAADGRGWTLRTLNVPELSSEVVKAIVTAVQSKPSANDVINMHHFHGAATRMAPDSAAFGQRREHVMVEIISGWRDDGPELHEKWADETLNALKEYALPGGYPNLLGPDAHAQIVQAYGNNAARLRSVKEKYDPQGVFTAIPLP